MAIKCIRDQAAVEIVERQCPVTGCGRQAGDRKGAAAVEGISGIIRAGVERNAVADADRKFAGTRNCRARIRIDIDGAALRPSHPGANA